MKVREKVDNEVRAMCGQPECYFCGFSDYVELHHIIPKSMGGIDESDNLIFLCPNHHKTIHTKKYFLQLTKGIYILVDAFDIKKKILPIDWKDKEKKDHPKISIQIAISQGHLQEDAPGKFHIPRSLKELENGWFRIEDKKI